jgi:hypothetical protein
MEEFYSVHAVRLLWCTLVFLSAAVHFCWFISNNCTSTLRCVIFSGVSPPPCLVAWVWFCAGLLCGYCFVLLTSSTGLLLHSGSLGLLFCHQVACLFCVYMWCSRECPLVGCPFAAFCITPRPGHVWLVCVTCLAYFSVFSCHIWCLLHVLYNISVIMAHLSNIHSCTCCILMPLENGLLGKCIQSMSMPVYGCLNKTKSLYKVK